MINTGLSVSEIFNSDKKFNELSMDKEYNLEAIALDEDERVSYAKLDGVVYCGNSKVLYKRLSIIADMCKLPIKVSFNEIRCARGRAIDIKLKCDA